MGEKKAGTFAGDVVAGGETPKGGGGRRGKREKAPNWKPWGSHNCTTFPVMPLHHGRIELSESYYHSRAVYICNWVPKLAKQFLFKGLFLNYVLF